MKVHGAASYEAKFTFPGVTNKHKISKLIKLILKVKVAQLCLTLCNSMDYTVHGILQARILECVAVPFSRGSFQSRDLILECHKYVINKLVAEYWHKSIGVTIVHRFRLRFR